MVIIMTTSAIPTAPTQTDTDLWVLGVIYSLLAVQGRNLSPYCVANMKCTGRRTLAA